MGSFLQKLLTNPEDFKFYTDLQKGVISPNNQNPRTIPFGNDKSGGGSSNQPYIKKSTTQTPGITLPGFGVGFGQVTPDIVIPGIKDNNKDTDFIIRGGISSLFHAVDDSTRLTRFFLDIKNPKGLLFLAKENILSRIGTKTEASKGAGYAGGGLNEGAYTPLSTIGQALVGFTGGHLNKQGLDPTGLINSLSINKYQDVIAGDQLRLNGSNDFEKNNRLFNLIPIPLIDPANLSLEEISKPVINKLVGKITLNPFLNFNTLIEYGGGPGSILGFGKTKIKFATKNNGVGKLTVFDSKTSSNLLNANGARYKTWDYSLINSQSLNLDGDIKNDFRTTNFYTTFNGSVASGGDSTFVSFSPDYKTYNIEDKLNLGNPGSRNRNRSSYTSGSYILPSQKGKALDKLNASSIDKSKTSDSLKTSDDYSDIIPFIISILNNEDQLEGPYRKNMHFRAFIDSFSDSYDAEWSSIDYMGRAEKLYKYKGFGRKISMAFTVVAQSKEEITAMYDKLNFLASSLAPEYLPSGYMAGNIAYITLGGYIFKQPGIITSLTFDIPEESPWEIGINDKGDRDYNIKQLPHMIKVTGFNFTPIHTFKPEKQRWEDDLKDPTSTKLIIPGGQIYIAKGNTRKPIITSEGSTNLGMTNGYSSIFKNKDGTTTIIPEGDNLITE